MRPFQANYTAADTTFLAPLQTSVTTGTSVYLILSTTNRDYSYIADTRIQTNPPFIARPGSISSTGNVSTLNYTFYGYDSYNQASSETVTGASGNTVYTTAHFLTITGILASTGFSTSISAGIGPGGTTVWFVPNRHVTPFNISAANIVTTNTCFYTMQSTYDNLFTIASFSSVNTFSDITITSSSAINTYTSPVNGIRCIINAASSTTTGVMKTIITQAGIM